MSRKSLYISLLIGLLLGSLAACSQRADDGVLSQNEMEDVLYDYYLAQALAADRAHAGDTLSAEDYADMVLAKHGISQATFDTSLLWYSRNSEAFYEVYERINQRLDRALGQVSTPSDNATRFATSGDTANVWAGRSVYLLLPMSYANALHFTQATDTLLRANDKIEWHFQSDFAYMSGNKSAIALLAIYYDNDSIATAVSRIYGNGAQVLSLVAANRPTKKVYGHIYFDEPIDNSNKLCVISDLALVRYKKQPLPTDTIARPSSADSLRSDSSKYADSIASIANKLQANGATP